MFVTHHMESQCRHATWPTYPLLSVKQPYASAPTPSILLKLYAGRDMTEAGFQFLLLDSYHQLWLLLKQYTEAEATRSGAGQVGFVHCPCWQSCAL